MGIWFVRDTEGVEIMSSGCAGAVMVRKDDGHVCTVCGEFVSTDAEAMAHLGRPVKPNPLDTQVGGDHYKNKGPYQPWVMIEKLGLDFFEGNALKYLIRWRDKNGVEDLKKAKHYLEYLIEREGKDA